MASKGAQKCLSKSLDYALTGRWSMIIAVRLVVMLARRFRIKRSLFVVIRKKLIAQSIMMIKAMIIK